MRHGLMEELDVSIKKKLQAVKVEITQLEQRKYSTETILKAYDEDILEREATIESLKAQVEGLPEKLQAHKDVIAKLDKASADRIQQQTEATEKRQAALDSRLTDVHERENEVTRKLTRLEAQKRELSETMTGHVESIREQVDTFVAKLVA